MTTRHDFYQTDNQLIVSIYKKGVPADKVRIEATPNQVEVYVDDECILDLSPLSGAINPDEITHKVYGTKIELKLLKATGGHWSSLVGASAGPAITQPSQVVTPAASTETNDAQKPTSSKKKNWDSLAKEFENADDEPHNTPDDFFKSLYGDLDPDSRRAMLKSYQESNGTVLSTNWGEVGKKYQAPQPPDGMEVRKK
ncbi:Cochaperone protein [Naganishia albida]|nr:Cochaperone protein [Naganishia albida]